MAIITLTTDYGNKDYSVSSLKAKLISNIDNTRIVDITHDISPFNLAEAGYVLEGAFGEFPKGTIHILSVDSELTPENRHIVIMYEESFFIGTDNGVFSLVFRDKKPDQIVEINLNSNYNYDISADELFVKVASHIKRSGPLNVVGTEIKKIKEITNLRPVINKEINQILGSVIYIDNYGNVVTNITEKLFKEISKTRPAVEAGENLGYLPGDLKEKLDPYMQPLYDALTDMIPRNKLEKFLEDRTIEIAPLAFMRGRTLDNAFVILDEAQNTTPAQMKMFLTRISLNHLILRLTGLKQKLSLFY